MNTPQELFKETQKRMEKCLLHTQEVLARFRTGRASVSLLEHVRVDYYGTPTPFLQLATVTNPEPQVLLVQPFDPNLLPAIEKALQSSDLGLSLKPATKGGEKAIVVRFPELSEERRKEMVRLVRKEAEEGRVALRNVRRDAMEVIKNWEKEKKYGEDELRRIRDQIQKLLDEYIGKVDQLLSQKEKELFPKGGSGE